MPWATIIPALAPLVLEALDGWLAAGKITQEQYDEAKKLYTDARTRSQAAVDDFNKWLSESDEPT